MTLKSLSTLIDSVDDVKTTGAFMARAKRRASRSIASRSSGGSVMKMSYFVPTSMAWAVLFKPAALAVPLLDRG